MNDAIDYEHAKIMKHIRDNWNQEVSVTPVGLVLEIDGLYGINRDLIADLREHGFVIDMVTPCTDTHGVNVWIKHE